MHHQLEAVDVAAALAKPEVVVHAAEPACPCETCATKPRVEHGLPGTVDGADAGAAVAGETHPRDAELARKADDDARQARLGVNVMMRVQMRDRQPAAARGLDLRPQLRDHDGSLSRIEAKRPLGAPPEAV